MAVVDLVFDVCSYTYIYIYTYIHIISLAHVHTVGRSTLYIRYRHAELKNVSAKCEEILCFKVFYFL